ncbi:MAG TPA: hypothetical protein VJ904_09165, partial [Tichowtungia sp.]|nr:hypothetical protein [Tichowtungia sp.]
QSWSTQPDSVQIRGENLGTENSSLLREFTLDRSDGASYTIEGVVHLTDGYADDNNRVGLYLFGDSSEVPDEYEAGAIGLIFNTDDGAGGTPDDNADDNIALRVGIDSTNLSGNQLRSQSPTPYAQDLFGTEIKFTADITFTNDNIAIEAVLTETDGTQTATSLTVAVADYTGDWFGFVTRARARNYIEGGSNSAAGRSLPWVMDYKSFRVTDNNAPELEGYDQWAEDHGGTNMIGSAMDDADFDGLSNLYEYGVGGDPTNRLSHGTIPTLSKSGNRFLYIHPQRSDDGSLTYTVETTTNLISGTWLSVGYTITGTNVTGGTLNFVTNDVDTVRNKNFIRLKIGQ